MGNLNKQVLGQVKGRIGDIVFREMGGKNYASVRPSSFNTPQDPASKARRSKFKMAVDFSKSINQMPELKAQWKLVSPTGFRQFNFIVKTNYFRVSGTAPGNSALLLPAGGFPFVPNSVDKTAARLHVTLDALGTNTGLNSAVETKIRMMSVLFMSNPADVINTPPYSFITMGSDILHLSLTEPLDFTAPLDGSETLLYNAYQDHKAYFVLITMDDEGNIIHYSITLNG